MMFGNIIVSGFQMIARAGFSQRNIIIAALSLAVGIGFTQVGDLFAIFPELVQSVFAQNCVAVVFLVAIVANLVLPKDARAGEGADAAADGASAAADGALAADGAGAGALGAGAAAAAGSAMASETGATSDAARANGLSDTAGLTGEFDEEQPAKA